MKKVYIITGANRGLGKGFVDILSEDEDNFIISISRRLSEEQENFSKENFHFLKVDLSRNELSQNLNELDTLINGNEVCFINNASIIDPITKVKDIQIDALDKIIAVNMKSPVVITKYILRHFNKNKLSFVNISSGAASRAIDSWSLYCSTKAFVEMFFDVAALEYKQHSFFNINPGVIDTGMQRNIRSSDFPDAPDFQKLEQDRRLQSPIEAAKLILETIS